LNENRKTSITSGVSYFAFREWRKGAFGTGRRQADMTIAGTGRAEAGEARKLGE